ncbi:flagellar basal-body MS-ring/collar protein FliF [Legionella hackeliae]|uniref:Flagellar M-ring protein n=1 Tax=Legionella hackeliae TaxID=449 RepID=A0A0A8UR83_LEGHA|nr:flagellar basal-body MS-ring/collar protein FliF [Legionella hackeliae]KTD15394.1 flagellar MS-ring protein [Legionella hackeliae]CEK11238.1 Flagellar MS-ring protein [Legionella hackeliae]STX48003.1 flagellar M-ring protein FliF [Legionella hackeliae]
MALADNASTAAARFASLSIPRQVGLMLGLAASVAIGVAVVLWSREPSYMPLYNEISTRDAADIVDSLQRNGIPFKVDQNQGTILVPTDEAQNARLKLAADGLPRGSGAGYELFADKSTFNTSQFMENARYKQALETELARTISQFHDVKSARVHLAIPRESAFVRDNREPSASVFIDVYPGVEIKKQTIASIINLVASSIPSLSASKVTVVDQNGQLLSEGGGQTLFTNTERYMEYRQTLEQQYVQKIQDILTPLLGFGRVKAKVSADIDFTNFEQTQETYNPESQSLRSEQKMEEKHNVDATATGVPGALSNTPPANAALKQNKDNKNNNNNNKQITNATETAQGNDYRAQTTKNFELDKTISHTKNQPGTVKRLTVAVLVDDRNVLNPKTKQMEAKPLTQAEVEQIKILVANAIGLNPKRGDSINVVNSHFVKPEPIDPIPDLHFWQKDSFWSIIKQVGAAIFILALVFGLFRPLFKSLIGQKREEEEQPEQAELTYQAQQNLLPHANDYESQLALLRQVVDKEPKRVAQVVKTWVERG